MVIQDAKRKVLKIWGGYSPKVYDGTFLEIYKSDFEKSFKGSCFIADQHFRFGTTFNKVKFHVAVNKGRRKGVKNLNGKGLVVLTKKDMSYNAAIYKARSRVEASFGEVKTKWLSLALCWAESEEQMDHLVWIAMAIHNIRAK